MTNENLSYFFKELSLLSFAVCSCLRLSTLSWKIYRLKIITRNFLKIFTKLVFLWRITKLVISQLLIGDIMHFLGMVRNFYSKGSWEYMIISGIALTFSVFHVLISWLFYSYPIYKLCERLEWRSRNIWNIEKVSAI